MGFLKDLTPKKVSQQQQQLDTLLDLWSCRDSSQRRRLEAFQRNTSISMDRTSSSAVNDTVAQIRQAAMESSRALELSTAFTDVENAVSLGLTPPKTGDCDFEEGKDEKLK